MIDFILFCFALGVFAGGFWCGAKFGTYAEMYAKAKAWVKS